MLVNCYATAPTLRDKDIEIDLSPFTPNGGLMLSYLLPSMWMVFRWLLDGL